MLICPLGSSVTEASSVLGQWAGGGGEGHEVGPGIYYAGFSTNRYSFSDSIDIFFMPSTALISVDTGQNYRVHPIMKGFETKTWLKMNKELSLTNVYVSPPLAQVLRMQI